MMKVNAPSAAFDQLVRQTRAHHVQLSGMADIKANILLTVSSLMLTFCLPYLAKPMLQWPALVMIVFCAATALSSILALIPKLPAAKRLRPAENPMFNLLFFGGFADLSYEEYEAEMEKTCNDLSLTYAAMAKDIYQLGCYLAHRKFYYLRVGYQLFLWGLFCAGATFILVEALHFGGAHVWTFGPQGTTRMDNLFEQFNQ